MKFIRTKNAKELINFNIKDIYYADLLIFNIIGGIHVICLYLIFPLLNLKRLGRFEVYFWQAELAIDLILGGFGYLLIYLKSLFRNVILNRIFSLAFSFDLLILLGILVYHVINNFPLWIRF